MKNLLFDLCKLSGVSGDEGDVAQAGGVAGEAGLIEPGDLVDQRRVLMAPGIGAAAEGIVAALNAGLVAVIEAGHARQGAHEGPQLQKAPPAQGVLPLGELFEAPRAFRPVFRTGFPGCGIES